MDPSEVEEGAMHGESAQQDLSSTQCSLHTLLYSPRRDVMSGEAIYFLTSDTVAELFDLLTEIAVAPGVSDDYCYKVEHSRGQVNQQMRAIDLLVLAGLLAEADSRAKLDCDTQDACRSWTLYLAGIFSGHATASAGAKKPPQLTGPHRSKTRGC
jgi:hypothetical protein